MKTPTTLVAIRDYLEAAKRGLYRYPLTYYDEHYEKMDLAYYKVQEVIDLVKSAMA
jgi:hypothetical protein